jgi:hypothetical protein
LFDDFFVSEDLVGDAVDPAGADTTALILDEEYVSEFCLPAEDLIVLEI